MSKQGRPGSGVFFWRRRLGFEPLEDRHLLTLFTVNTAADENNGIGIGGVSLRDAVAAASTGDTINFSIGGTINLTTAAFRRDSDHIGHYDSGTRGELAHDSGVRRKHRIDQPQRRPAGVSR